MRKTDIYIAITTYNRPEDFKLLMEDIEDETVGKRVHIHVYDDCSKEEYEHKDGYTVTRYGKNNGKRGYWQIMNDVFRDAETWDFKYFFFLQDDCRLAQNFFERAIAEYEAIPAGNKATLCTFTPENVYERVMWGNAKAVDAIHEGSTFIQGRYVDCIFMCPRETLKELEFKVEPVLPTRFKGSEVISSGVGQQLTMRLARKMMSMWTCYSSLIIQHSNDSKMNKEEREKNPMNPLIRKNTQEFDISELLSMSREKITVGMASIKDREHAMEQAVLSLIDQVDHIHIYLNDYEKVPNFLQNNGKISFYLGKIFKDRGDTGKFFGMDKAEGGYYFTCDDDLIYPPDYVSRTVDYMKETKNAFIITYHGAILNKGPIKDYYRDRKQIHYSTFQREPIKVDIGGTGVMAFHLDTFRPDTKRFLHPNMADIWVGILAQEQKIPIICAPRPLQWIKAEEMPIEGTIYGSKKNHDLQTEAINDYKKLKGEFI